MQRRAWRAGRRLGPPSAVSARPWGTLPSAFQVWQNIANVKLYGRRHDEQWIRLVAQTGACSRLVAGRARRAYEHGLAGQRCSINGLRPPCSGLGHGFRRPRCLAGWSDNLWDEIGALSCVAYAGPATRCGRGPPEAGQSAPSPVPTLPPLPSFTGTRTRGSRAGRSARSAPAGDQCYRGDARGR